MLGLVRTRLVLLLALPLLSARLSAQGSAAPAAPPAAARITRVDTVAGVEWPDAYAWLRDDQRQNPEVLAYLRAENAYAEAVTRHSRAWRRVCSRTWWVASRRRTCRCPS